jgi:hypothetical protein
MARSWSEVRADADLNEDEVTRRKAEAEDEIERFEEHLETRIGTLADMADEEPERFDRAVLAYVLHPGDDHGYHQREVFRDPDLVEDTYEALGRLSADLQAEVGRRYAMGDPIVEAKRQLGRVRAERRIVRPLANHEKARRVAAEAKGSPADRARKRLQNARCDHCKTPLAGLYRRLVREEEAK